MNILAVITDVSTQLVQLYRNVKALASKHAITQTRYRYHRVTASLSLLIYCQVSSLAAIDIHELRLPQAVAIDVKHQLSIFPQKPQSYLDLVIRLRIHPSPRQSDKEIIDPIAWAYLPDLPGNLYRVIIDPDSTYPQNIIGSLFLHPQKMSLVPTNPLT